MIIKGLFRRYKKWNPVHPTYGAFYGMGFGIGCGVGWGPGFGPEVVGYVGSGCGVGFNVGVTLAGFGIGLPANIIFAAPYNAFLATKSSALKLARSGTQTAEDVWIRNSPLVSDFQREAGEKFSCFRQKYLSINGTDFFDVKNSLPLLTASACKNIQTFHDQFFPHKGKEDS
ncbi:cadmium-induced protein AS8-like [Vicia villosa]|uniref:cadmium-induced protein AS8-like n=1 Tax=Vicia villosa TaxID=3911 RepID=UPI00273CD8CE|nr:cadmium-induced protein AS8-like [Vicia villosa]